MIGDIENIPQVIVAPRCPACGSSNSAICRSKGFKLEHAGQSRHAQKQFRQCRECRKNFAVIHIKGLVEAKNRRLRVKK